MVQLIDWFLRGDVYPVLLFKSNIFAGSGTPFMPFYLSQILIGRHNNI